MPKRRQSNGVRVALTDPVKLQLMTLDDYVAALMRTARNSSHGLQGILRPPDPEQIRQTRSTTAPRRQTAARCPIRSTRWWPSSSLWADGRCRATLRADLVVSGRSGWCKYNRAQCLCLQQTIRPLGGGGYEHR